MNVVGHGSVVSQIEAEMPRVALFLGPTSVGKWTVAEYLRGAWRVAEGDTLRIENLTADAARSVVDFALYSPVGSRRLVVIRLDGASAGALNILLKTLEDAAETTDFILVADEPPIATIVTRSAVYRFGFLADGEVQEVLQQRNFREDDAQRYARMSGGQVSRALAVVNGVDVLHTVRLAIRAFREMDPGVLETAAREWTENHSAMLAQWCRENLSGRPRIFSDEEFLPRSIVLKVLTALNVNARPRLVVRSGLMAVARGEA